MKFFIYSRKSVDTGRGESIGNQIELCKQYIAAKFPSEAGAELTVYEDEGFSAKNTDRPQFQQMLHDIKRDKPDYLVCYRLDRISRSVSDFSALIENLNRCGISFVCIKEEFDTSKPMGKAMMYIASVFAQLERETIAERVRDNMLLLARTGRWLGGTTPTGYTSENLREFVVDGKSKTSCALKGNPDELRAVDVMFEKFSELQSVSGVSKYLMKQGLRSRGGGTFSLLGIKEILQNPVYCLADKDALAYFTSHHADVCFGESDCSDKYGLLAYNKRDYRKKHAPRQSIDRWIVAIGKHPGRIPGKQWVEVQNVIEAHAPTGNKSANPHNDYALLSGLLYCERCGSRMFAKRRTGKGVLSGAFDYLCDSKLRGGRARCDSQNINGRQADSTVWEALLPHVEETSGIYELLEGLKRGLRRQSRENPIAALDAGIKKRNEETDRLIRALSQDIHGALTQRIGTRVTALEQELAELTAERDRLQQGEAAQSEEEPQRIAAALSNWKSGSADLSTQEKRVLLKLLIRKIVWDGTGLHILLENEPFER